MCNIKKEKLFYQKDKSLYGQQQQKFKLNCISCGQLDHYLFSCPYITASMRYKPNKQQNERCGYFRRRKEKQSFLLKGLNDLQAQAMAVIADNDKSLIQDAMSAYKSSIFSSNTDADLAANDADQIQSSCLLHSNCSFKSQFDNDIDNNQIHPTHSVSENNLAKVLDSSYQFNKTLSIPYNYNLQKSKSASPTYHDQDSFDKIKLYPIRIHFDQFDQDRILIQDSDQKFQQFKNTKKNEKTQEKKTLIKNEISIYKEFEEKINRKKAQSSQEMYKRIYQFGETPDKDKKIIFQSVRVMQQNDKNFQTNDKHIQTNNEKDQKDKTNENLELITKNYKEITIPFQSLESQEMLLLKQTFEKRQKRSKQQFEEVNEMINNRIKKQNILGSKNSHQSDEAGSEIKDIQDSKGYQTKDSKISRKSFLSIVQQLAKFQAGNQNRNRHTLQNQIGGDNVISNNNEKEVEYEQNENKINIQLNQQVSGVEVLINNQIATTPKDDTKQNKSNEFFQSSVHRIRCELNLQDLDMLVVRKKFLLLQQQNIIQNFIEVSDNEIDIDLLKSYNHYYRNQNVKQILTQILQKKQIGQKQQMVRGQVRKKTTFQKRRNAKKQVIQNQQPYLQNKQPNSLF